MTKTTSQYVTDPAALATDPRFATDGTSLFNEIAAQHGQDAAGLAFMAAFLYLRETAA